MLPGSSIGAEDRTIQMQPRGLTTTLKAASRHCTPILRLEVMRALHCHDGVTTLPSGGIRSLRTHGLVACSINKVAALIRTPGSVIFGLDAVAISPPQSR